MQDKVVPDSGNELGTIYSPLKLQILWVVHVAKPVHIPTIQLRAVQYPARLGGRLQGTQGILLQGATGIDNQARGELPGSEAARNESMALLGTGR